MEKFNCRLSFIVTETTSNEQITTKKISTGIQQLITNN